MPFKSKQQMKWMYATHPKMAKRWTKEQEKEKGKGSFKKLPKKVKSKDSWEDEGWESSDEGWDLTIAQMESIR